jgi:hypothetical protein
MVIVEGLALVLALLGFLTAAAFEHPFRKRWPSVTTSLPTGEASPTHSFQQTLALSTAAFAPGSPLRDALALGGTISDDRAEIFARAANDNEDVASSASSQSHTAAVEAP